MCSHDAGASRTGVKFSSEANFAVDLQIDASLGSSEKKPAWSKELFQKSEPLLSKCFPISIPGLDKSSKTMTTSTSTNSVVGTSSLYTGVPSSLVASALGTAPIPTAVGNSSSYIGAPSSLVASAPGTAPMPTAVGTSSTYISVPLSLVASAPGTASMPPAAVPTTTNVPSASIPHVKRGSSGCGLARRHGKRMLIC